jgi:hypothetical protein
MMYNNIDSAEFQILLISRICHRGYKKTRTPSESPVVPANRVTPVRRNVIMVSFLINEMHPALPPDATLNNDGDVKILKKPVFRTRS